MVSLIQGNARHHAPSSSPRGHKTRCHLNSRPHSTESAPTQAAVPHTVARAASACSSGSGNEGGGGAGRVKWRPMQESAVVSHLRMNTDVANSATIAPKSAATIHSSGSTSNENLEAAVASALATATAAATEQGNAVTLPPPAPQGLSKSPRLRQQHVLQRPQQQLQASGKQQPEGNYLSAENITAAMEKLTTTQPAAEHRQQRNQHSGSASEQVARRAPSSSKGTNSGSGTPRGSSSFQPPGLADQSPNRTVRQASPALGHRPTVSPPIGTFPQRRPMRILVVDDSLICQKVLAQALSKMGYLTDVADNGRAALDKLVHVPCLFDAVVMDVIMPIMDGYTATRVCRQELHLTIPILILSADVLPDTRQCMLSVGASAFVIKPVKLMEMVEIFHSFNVQTPGSVAYLEGMHRQRHVAQLKEEQRIQAQLQRQQQKMQQSDSDSNGRQEFEQQQAGTDAT